MPSATPPALDPFDRVHALGRRESLTGGALGIFFACSSHVAALALALTFFQGARALAATTSELEIEVAPVETAVPPPPPPPAPEPEVEPPPPAPPPPVTKPEKEIKEDPYEEDDLPPPPSEAAKIITAPAEPNDPPAPSDQTFASGEGKGSGGGFVAGAGTGNGTTYDPRARVGNKVPTKPPPETNRNYPDLSRRAAPYYGVASGCDMPDGIDGDVAVPVNVTVGTDGKAISVEILSDPGRGLGAAARRCAMRSKYRPARDAAGQLIVSTIGPVRVRFTR